MAPAVFLTVAAFHSILSNTCLTDPPQRQFVTKHEFANNSQTYLASFHLVQGWGYQDTTQFMGSPAHQ